MEADDRKAAELAMIENLQREDLNLSLIHIYRNGKVLVSSRSSYNLTFDASLLDDGEDANEAILRLLQLCQSRGISWADYLLSLIHI